MRTPRSNQVASDTTLMAGIEKHVGPDESFTIEGKKFTVAEILVVLQGRVDKLKAIPPAKASLRSVLDAANAEVDRTDPLIGSVRQILRVMFGAAPDVLADMGIALRKPQRERTLEGKTKSALKAKATREARHTMGKRKRLAITGSVPAPANGASPPSPDGNGAAPAPA